MDTAAETARSIGVGLLGCGVVGGATARILTEHSVDIQRSAGARVELRRIAVRNPSKARGIDVPDHLWTSDPWDVVKDPDVGIVVELMGGIEPARDLALAAMASGKHVVTANKELLSTRGNELMAAASKHGVDLLFEASVGGGIPIIRPMKESLTGDRVTRVMGIVNGTTNFILTRMSDTGVTFSDALDEARLLGYAEADPSADIEGFDAASKVAILASIAFGARVTARDVHREGIAAVTAADIRAAHELGYEIKLLALAERHNGGVAVRVHPAMLPKTHPLASVRDVLNAVFIEGQHVGELMLLGRGAGGAPTATAVVSDVVESARNIVTGARSPAWRSDETAVITPQEQARVRYYVVLSVADQPGVLAQVATVFARYGVSIASVRQEGFDDQATLVLVTHVSSEGDHQSTFADLSGLEVVKSITSKMRVEGTAEA